MPPNPSLDRIEAKLDELREDIGVLTTQVAVLTEHVRRQNGRIEKTEARSQANEKELAGMQQAIKNLVDMEKRAWQVVIAVSLSLLGAVVAVVSAILTGRLQIAP